MNKYWLYIDDVRFPEEFLVQEMNLVLARSSLDAVRLVKRNGLPTHISFDHDLGDDDTSIVFIKWMIETYPIGPIPSYNVHSANPVGASNIVSYMESWKKSLNF